MRKCSEMFTAVSLTFLLLTSCSQQSAIALPSSIPQGDNKAFTQPETTTHAQPTATEATEAPAILGNSDEQAELASLKQQVKMLERAVATETPEAAVNTWAKAVYTRNGALEFAILSKKLREEQRSTLEEGGWVTGVSSPWLEQYQISEGTDQADGTVIFQVKFDYRTSMDAEQKVDWSVIEPFHVVVGEASGNWYVNAIGDT